MGAVMYDQNNIFAKILRGEKIAQGLYYLSFYDIAPKAPVHALVIPTGSYQSAHDFSDKAASDEIVGFYKGVNETLEALGLKANGYRLISNTGVHGRQEVPHFHIHILGGHDLGPKVVMP
jgi:diadenosine tetraphosphate (Ap4A) HIT family hydrolase